MRSTCNTKAYRRKSIGSHYVT